MVLFKALVSIDLNSVKMGGIMHAKISKLQLNHTNHAILIHIDKAVPT